MPASNKKLFAALAALILTAALAVFLLRDRDGSKATEPAMSSEPLGLTVYSGRSEKLVGSLFTQFEKKTGIPVKVRYGETPQLAAMLLEEGQRSPADVYLAQDAGALGALAKAEAFAKLPDSILSRVPDARFKSPEGEWIGLSGRARVIAYNSRKLEPASLPRSIRELVDPAWKGRVGWAPTNASFQAFVTALRALDGEEAAARWLDGMKANQPRTYKNNAAIVEALSRGEVDLGLVNHYYVFAAEKGRTEPLPVANHYLAKDDPGALINVAGMGVLRSSKNQAGAHRLIEFMLGAEAQTHFAKETFEYPLSSTIGIDPRLRPIAEVGSPELDLSKLEALQGTVRLLQEKGIL